MNTESGMAKFTPMGWLSLYLGVVREATAGRPEGRRALDDEPGQLPAVPRPSLLKEPSDVELDRRFGDSEPARNLFVRELFLQTIQDPLLRPRERPAGHAVESQRRDPVDPLR